MKRLINKTKPFTCTFSRGRFYKCVNKYDETLEEQGKTKNVYLRSNGFTTAFIDKNGYLHLYPSWNVNKTSLTHLCKFTGVSSKIIKAMIESKSPFIILEKESFVRQKRKEE